jgi:hypothetical protein
MSRRDRVTRSRRSTIDNTTNMVADSADQSLVSTYLYRDARLRRHHPAMAQAAPERAWCPDRRR